MATPSTTAVASPTTTTTPGTAGGIKQESPPTSVGNGNAHIRSRITVVCAECKRLKLKCDRRTPCSSCLKRDTVTRCLYSAAAAEKIDVQSLHNRVSVLESTMSALSSGGLLHAAQASLANIPGSSSSMRDNHHPPQRAIVASGTTGSSVLISLEDVSGVWLDELDLVDDDSSGISLRPLPPPPTMPSGSGTLAAYLSISPSLFLPPSSSSDPSATVYVHPQVTPAVLTFIPSNSITRDLLLSTLENIMDLHPVVNWPHFRSRVRNVLSVGDKILSSSSSSSSSSTRKTSSMHVASSSSSSSPDSELSRALSAVSLSFFSALCAGLALASRVLSSPQPGADPYTLYALSTQALNIAAMSTPYDLDYLVACILRILFMLHGGGVAMEGEIVGAIGHMVNVSRLMGMWIDPDDITQPRYCLFEAEMRRRIWWDVYYFDLFVSDALGLPPLIPDDALMYSVRIPADVNEDQFIPNSTSLPEVVSGSRGFEWFGIKCRLAQLVKSMRRRTFRDPLVFPPPPPSLYDPPSSPATDMESTISLESDIASFLSSLPTHFKLDMLEEDLNKIIERTPEDILAKQVDVACICARLVIGIFVPFLRRNGSGFVNGGGMPPHHAVHACVNAAHTIIHGSRLTHTLISRKSTSPSRHGLSLFYSFGRQLFDAAVISAHSVITAPQSLFARVAMEDLKRALEIMRDPIINAGVKGLGEGTGAPPTEALKIVEILKTKAETARSGSGAATTVTPGGTKRKYGEMEDATFKVGFQLPYVGAAVGTASTTISTQLGQPFASASSAAATYPSPSTPSSALTSKAPRYSTDQTHPTATSPRLTTGPSPASAPPTKKEGGGRKGSYPQVGVRIRSTTKGTEAGRGSVPPTPTTVKSQPPTPATPTTKKMPTPPLPPVTVSPSNNMNMPPPQPAEMLTPASSSVASGSTPTGAPPPILHPADGDYSSASPNPPTTVFHDDASMMHYHNAHYNNPTASLSSVRGPSPHGMQHMERAIYDTATASYETSTSAGGGGNGPAYYFSHPQSHQQQMLGLPQTPQYTDSNALDVYNAMCPPASTPTNWQTEQGRYQPQQNPSGGGGGGASGGTAWPTGYPY